MNNEDFKTWKANRDQAISGSLENYIKYAKEQGVYFSSTEVAEIAYHKSRTAITSLSPEVRAASDKWLKDHNYESWL